jgi:hypothetical protein
MGPDPLAMDSGSLAVDPSVDAGSGPPVMDPGSLAMDPSADAGLIVPAASPADMDPGIRSWILVSGCAMLVWKQ